ncbi:MAG: cytochrome D1 domain-containing protein [Pseudomonas sp.]|uniref:YncE family protein n=1 Tax=Pseudomonas sp. TaxID=306 RepID=UPI00299ECCF2|nr:cytochrome D1 domain-containing protein [Pseudomonas sp.]MDX1723666.1 cytochrome D1 domain-containing protein [Pseudomonas sp.]
MKRVHNPLLVAGIALLLSGSLAAVTPASSAATPAVAAATPLPAAGPNTSARGHLERDGIAIDFEARPVTSGGVLTEGQFADIRFRLSDVASGQPLRGQVPGVWLDQALNVPGQQGGQMACKTRIGQYLRGAVGVRPMLDLNSYYLLILNKDPSIMVIDPLTSVAGITSTLTRIGLKKAPMDWVTSADDKRLFVSMPDAGEVAVIDAENFKVLSNIAAGKQPVRVALQPDGRYLWVGNNASSEADSGVTVIDTRTLEPVLSAATGKGHHEIAFSEDSRHAFVTSRDAGMLTVFDVATLKVLRQIPTGPHPLAVAQSALSGAVYVADGKAGTVTVIDTRSFKTRKVITLQQGIGPLRVTQDGRYAFVLNTLENSATVIDAGSDEVLHTLDVAAEPYQLMFTRGFAYIRGLATPKVSMVDLNSLGKGRQPSVLGFEAGPQAPKLAGDLPLAASFSAARDDAAVFVVNPVDNTTYFYMEGMNAPMFGYLNRGHAARAAGVVDRSLREEEPGVFSARVKLPAAGRFDVAFMLNQPEILHCFTAEVQTNPELQQLRTTLRIMFLQDSPWVSVGSPAAVRFRLLQGSLDQPKIGVEDIRLRYFLAPSARPHEVAAQEVGNGVYEAQVPIEEAGAYYLHVGSTSLGLKFGDLPYTSLRAHPVASAKVKGAP